MWNRTNNDWILLKFPQGCEFWQNGGQLLSKLVTILAAAKTERKRKRSEKKIRTKEALIVNQKLWCKNCLWKMSASLGTQKRENTIALTAREVGVILSLGAFSDVGLESFCGKTCCLYPPARYCYCPYYFDSHYNLHNNTWPQFSLAVWNGNFRNNLIL